MGYIILSLNGMCVKVLTKPYKDSATLVLN